MVVLRGMESELFSIESQKLSKSSGLVTWVRKLEGSGRFMGFIILNSIIFEVVMGDLKNSIQPITSRIRSLIMEGSPSFTVMGFNNSAFSVSEGATEIIGSPCNRS